MTKRKSRRESREVAFLLLFEWSFQQEELEEIIEQAEKGRELEVDSFARELAFRTVSHCEELDALIQRYSEKWKVNRLSKVTLAALRLAFCELSRFPGIPVGATINEAVELVKKFGAEDESSYVNGILGGYARDDRQPEVE